MKQHTMVLSRYGFAGIAILAALILLPTFLCAQEKPSCTLPDCDQAKAFFARFQGAMRTDQRQEVAAMVSYPLRSNRNGKATVIRNKADLMAHYDTVFDTVTRCAIQAATVNDVWGNWQGFMVSGGAIWWDRVIPKSALQSGTIQPTDLAKFPFGIISVNHSAETEKNCAGNTNTSPK